MTAKSKDLVFQGTEIKTIERNGERWLTGLQIASALEFANPRADIANIYRRHKGEFTRDMTDLIKQGRTRVRAFSPRGAWLIAMFARTPRAAAFRHWVLDVLEGKEGPSAQALERAFEHGYNTCKAHQMIRDARSMIDSIDLGPSPMTREDVGKAFDASLLLLTADSISLKPKGQIQ